MKVNNKTSFKDTSLHEVEWYDVDISGLSIGEDDVNYFWEVVSCTRNTLIYDAKFAQITDKNKQNILYRELKKSSAQYLKNNELNAIAYDIFISYASEEKDIYALPLYRLLHQENRHSVWLDAGQLTESAKLRLSIESVLSRCNLVIIILSDNYLYKGWTRYELYRTIEECRKRKLQVIILDSMTNNTIDKDLLHDIYDFAPEDNRFSVEHKSYLSQISDRVNNCLTK